MFFVFVLSLASCSGEDKQSGLLTTSGFSSDLSTDESIDEDTVTETTADLTETVPEETTADAAGDGISPEFKEAMDSYEAFFREYCEIIKQYRENPSDAALLAKYSEYLVQYAETMSKLEAIDEDSLSEAELLYYTEVSGRITEMLLEVAY